jgi:hypothetical protein
MQRSVMIKVPRGRADSERFCHRDEVNEKISGNGSVFVLGNQGWLSYAPPNLLAP